MTAKIDLKAVNIGCNSGKAPRTIVDTLVAGQAYPFTATLKHKNIWPLVVPSSGVSTVIDPGVDTKVKVKSFEQAWVLVTDLAELAIHAGSTEEAFAVITVDPIPKTTPPPESAPAVEPKPPAGKAAKEAV